MLRGRMEVQGNAGGGAALTVALMLAPTGPMGMAQGDTDTPVALSCTAPTLLDATSLDPEKNVGRLISSLGKSRPKAARMSAPFRLLYFSACTVARDHLNMETAAALPKD